MMQLLVLPVTQLSINQSNPEGVTFVRSVLNIFSILTIYARFKIDASLCHHFWSWSKSSQSAFCEYILQLMTLASQMKDLALGHRNRKSTINLFKNFFQLYQLNFALPSHQLTLFNTNNQLGRRNLVGKCVGQVVKKFSSTEEKDENSPLEKCCMSSTQAQVLLDLGHCMQEDFLIQRSPQNFISVTERLWQSIFCSLTFLLFLKN